jgi:hypothetical protein
MVLKFMLLAGAAVLTGLVAVYLFFGGPGFDGTVASLDLADGSEYRVTQNWNSWGEPYAVHFYMKEPTGKWGWCYLDHQSLRWRNAKLAYNAAIDSVSVTERGKLMATLDRSKRVFILHRDSGPDDRQAPQTELQHSPL